MKNEPAEPLPKILTDLPSRSLENKSPEPLAADSFSPPAKQMDGASQLSNAESMGPPGEMPIESFHSVDPRQITMGRIGGLIFSGIVLMAWLIALLIVFFSRGFDWIWVLVAGAGGAFVVFWLVLGLVWPVWEYRRTAWRLSDTGLEIRRGVVWRHQISVPVARVQHADVSQGPLQRYFELGKLTVHTAGTQNPSVELDGIAHAQAIRLRDQIVNQRRGADVV
jgi:hypothetical protein